MFRLRRCVTFLVGLAVLALVSHPLLTAPHNRLGKLQNRTIPEAPSAVNTTDTGTQRPNNDYEKLPIYFEPNLGQMDSQVKFIARGSGATTFLTATEAVFSLPIADFRLPNGKQSIKQIAYGDPAIWDQRLLDLSPWNLASGHARSRLESTPLDSPQSTIANRQSVIRMKLVGANLNAQTEGLDRLPGISNYFIGNDPNKWRTNIPHYGKVRYHDVYPDIDVVYYGSERNLEYDLVVRPGGNPDKARIVFDGAESVRLDAEGNAIISHTSGELRLHRPRIHQERGSVQMEVAGRFVLRGNAAVGFALGSYDPGQTLTIDPVLSYATYLGGNLAEVPSAIAVDSTGAAYVTGYTKSLNFPVTPGVFQPSHPGTPCGGSVFTAPCDQVFISKINAAGTALLYSTYLGGRTPVAETAGGDRATAIALDSQGNVIVAGWTNSTDFPTFAALQPSNKGLVDGFLTKLNSTGSGLLFSTYLGASDSEVASALAVDGFGNSYVALPNSGAPDLPMSSNTHHVFGSNKGTLVLKVMPTGSALVYSVVIGATTANAIAVDSAGAAYLAGHADETGFPTVNALQPAFGGGAGGGSVGYFGDAFVTKIDPTGTSVVYSTYLGGGSVDSVFSIAVDPAQNAYVAGATKSSDFPTTPGAFSLYQPTLTEETGNHFVAKISASGMSLVYSTYLPSKHPIGGAQCGIAVDALGQATVVASTSNPDFPVKDAIQPYYGGKIDFSVDGGQLEDFDAYVIKLNSTGKAAVYSTFLGGSRRDLGNAVALDSSGNVYVAGVTRSADLPTYRALRSTLIADPGPPSFIYAGDLFLAKIDTSPSVSISSMAAPFNAEGGNGSIAISAPAGFTWTAASQAEWITITSGSSAVGSGTVTYDVTPLPLNSSPRTGTLVVAGKVFRVSQEADDIFVPAVFSVAGLSNSFFTSELTLANRGNQPATLLFTYTATSDMGGGSGAGMDTLAAGHQRIIPDAIAYLRTLGIPIPDSGSRLGTLRIRVAGVLTSEMAALVRATTPVAAGRVGLAYAGIPTSKALTGTSFICGLRQNSADRSNLAVQNVGTSLDGEIVLRLTAFSGDPGAPVQQALPELRLGPGEFRQISGILESGGLSSGYVKVERVSGSAPYYSYGIINDQHNSDGSFVAPQRTEDFPLFLPAVVETSLYSSEVVVANTSTVDKSLRFTFRAGAVQTPENSASYRLPIKAGQQIIIPDFVNFLRQNGVEGVQAVGPTYAGHLFVEPLVPGSKFESFDPYGVFTAVRVSTPGAGGRIGLFVGGVGLPSGSSASSWLFGLQQNGEARSNLALVNPLLAPGENPSVFRIEIFDGDSGQRVRTLVNVNGGVAGWRQINSILADYAPSVQQGYVRISPIRADIPFVTYGVINDGASPGERTGDGAFISSSP